MCHARQHAKASWWRGIPKQHAPAIDAEPGRACPSARAAYMRRVVHIYCLRLAKVLTLVLLRKYFIHCCVNKKYRHRLPL